MMSTKPRETRGRRDSQGGGMVRLIPHNKYSYWEEGGA